MRRILLADLHIGARSNELSIMKHQISFFEQFVLHVKNEGIEEVVIAGDVFDSRKSVNVRTFDAFKKTLWIPLNQMKIKMVIIPGNHDFYYHHSNDVTSLSMLEEFENIEIIKEQKIVHWDIGDVLLVPWLATHEDVESLKKNIESKKPKCIIGHFAFEGFEMMPGIECREGLSTSFFTGDMHTFSGHFHIHQTIGNITYIGSPYELNWGDHESPKGYYVIDKDVVFCRNENHLFISHNFKPEQNVDVELFRDKFVKVIVEEGMVDTDAVSGFVDKIQTACPADVKVIIPRLRKDDVADDEEVEIGENRSFLDTLLQYSSIKKYGERVDKFLVQVYNEVNS